MSDFRGCLGIVDTQGNSTFRQVDLLVPFRSLRPLHEYAPSLSIVKSVNNPFYFN